MKKSIALALVFLVLSSPVSAKDWKGRNVLIPKDTLLCDYFHLQNVNALLSAGDKASIQAYVNNGYCAFAPNSFYAAVTNDTSSFSDEPMVEITIKGESIWVRKGAPVCCYEKSNDEWVRIGKAAPPPHVTARKGKCTPEEALKAYVENQKRTGDETPPPPPFMAAQLPCPGDY